MDKFKAVGKFVVDGVRHTGSAASSAADTVAKRGRLAFVTKVLQRVDVSVSPEFEARRVAADEALRIQTEMHRSFEKVVGLFASVGQEVAKINDLLQEFRTALAPIEAIADSALASRHWGAEDDARVAKLNSEMREEASKLIKQVEATSTTLRHSCANLIDGSLQQLRADAGSAKCSVRESQVSLDLARSDLIAAQEQLENVEATLEELRTATGGSMRTIDVGMQFDVEKARQHVSRREAAVENKQSAFDAAVRDGTKSLDYTLEQVSMATWSCFNVFFTELSNFFSGGAPVALELSNAIRGLKNMQGVARQLTHERRERLDRDYGEALARATPPASPQPGQSTTSPTTTATTTANTAGPATSFFDNYPGAAPAPAGTGRSSTEVFHDDGASRSGSAGRIGPAGTSGQVDFDALFN